MSERFEVETWSISEAVYWITYRTEPGAGPKIIEPPSGYDLMLEPRNMAALKARAIGEPRTWPPHRRILEPFCHSAGSDPTTPAYIFRRNVKRWMRETGLDAGELFLKATADLAAYHVQKAAEAQQNLELNKALRELNSAIRCGALIASGRPKPTQAEPRSPPRRKPIPAHFIDPPRAITHWGEYCIAEYDGFAWMHDEGPFFYDIEVRAEDVRELWKGSKNVAADKEFATAWQSAEAALEPWFESEAKFANLPEKVREHVKRSLIPTLWDGTSPTRRLAMARMFDAQNTPILAPAHDAMWQQLGEVHKLIDTIQQWERLSADKPTELEAKEMNLLRLRKELAAAEVSLQHAERKGDLASGSDEGVLSAVPAISSLSLVKKKSIPPSDLLRWWIRYIALYSDPEKRPDVGAQRAAATAAFPNYRPPLEKVMQDLRSHKATPPEWRQQGRRPKSN